MQTIAYTRPNLHPIFDDMQELYRITSEKAPAEKFTVDKSFSALMDLFVEYGGLYAQYDEISKPYQKIDFNGSDDDVILCFSGGKDSIATAKMLADEGYSVHLYHLRKINPPLFDEYKCAERIAEHLGMPIYVDEVKLSGKHDWIEHPMKNILIANGALQYGIREGLTTKIAFGNYTTSSVNDDNFGFCGGDDIETWRAYEDIMRRVIPDFEMTIVLDNINDTLSRVCYDTELLEMSISCLGRASMRRYWHDWVKTKFGVTLPTYRCGRCYKCCMEYIFMADHDLQTYSPEYYLYCFNNLKKNVQREDEARYSTDYVWNHYFFYPMSKSKYFGG